MKRTRLSELRGDLIAIPIEADLKEGAVYRSQLRLNPESENYYTLMISGNNVIISPEQSFNLKQGLWYIEIEENDNGAISTIQRTLLTIKNDVTKTYGEAAPEWATNQSIEVAEVISRNYFYRLDSGALVPVTFGDGGEIDLSNYALTTHNHTLDSLSEKSYNSLTDKPIIPTINPATVIDNDYLSDKARLANTSGNNTGDQDLSGFALSGHTHNEYQSVIEYTPENTANKGVSNGYAGLDSGGKIPVSNLPSTLLIYKGVWNASTNTPLLSNDISKAGFVYNVAVAGTQFDISFSLGDWLIFNDAGIIEKSDNSDDVVSVNNKQGVVILNADDINDDNTSHKFVTSAEKTKLGNLSGTNSGDQDLSGYALNGHTHSYLSSVSSDSTPTLGGDLVLNNKSVNLTATLVANLSYSGFYEVAEVGEAVSFGDVLYFNFSTLKWMKAKADVYTTAPAQRMALGTISANTTGKLLIEGFVRLDSWSFTSANVYLSAATAGAITSTQPSAAGNQLLRIGYAFASNKLHFRPSQDIGEI